MSAPRSLLGSLLALVVALGGTASADVRPGDVITRANADAVKDLVSPGMYWCVQRGFPMKITETQKIPLRRALTEATEKYSAQVRLSADGTRMEGFVAGRPFPRVDPNEPQAAMKLMYNFSYAIAFDDLDVRNFDADTGPISLDRPLQVERHFLIDHFRRLYYVGRLYVDPKPALPNSEGYHYKETLKPLIEPFDLKGVGFLYYRYTDPAKQDDSWLYLPSLRRVRRLSTAQRSDALFGQDTDQDSYGGYAGAIAWMDWKLLGARTVLASFKSALPVTWAEGAADWAFEAEWEKREMWVVEGVSKLPQYAYGKRVLFLDKETYLVLYSDIYDRSGELWKIWINDWTFLRKAPVSGAIEYPDEIGVQPAIVMVDIQLEHATRAALPSLRFPGEQGWYFNQGEKAGITDDWFTVAALVAAGH